MCDAFEGWIVEVCLSVSMLQYVVSFPWLLVAFVSAWCENRVSAPLSGSERRARVNMRTAAARWHLPIETPLLTRHCLRGKTTNRTLYIVNTSSLRILYLYICIHIYIYILCICLTCSHPAAAAHHFASILRLGPRKFQALARAPNMPAPILTEYQAWTQAEFAHMAGEPQFVCWVDDVILFVVIPFTYKMISHVKLHLRNAWDFRSLWYGFASNIGCV